ncbi:phage minor capsid protein [Jeotgalibacillus malaysiensis]|uniref:phage minor capsid protein n=1 Tax=Jeotgalibacillus malaysiensis TaxID=1508404 RepID=UPI00384C349F
MSIEELDEEAQELINEYTLAYAFVLSQIFWMIDKGGGKSFEDRAIDRIQNRLTRLNNTVKRFIDKQISEYYFSSLSDIDKKASSLKGIVSMDDSFSMIHKQALKQAQNDLFNDLARNTIYMNEDAKKVIREASKTILTDMIESGESYKTIKKKLKDDIAAKGITSFVDASKRRWKIDKYVDMAVRTKSRIIHNTGTLNRLAEYRERYSDNENFDLIQISNHSASDWCRHFEDKVFSISGNSKKYPPLSSLPNYGYNTLHPGCKHLFLSYMPAFQGEGKSASNKYLNNNIKELNKQDYHSRK